MNIKMQTDNKKQTIGNIYVRMTDKTDKKEGKDRIQGRNHCKKIFKKIYIFFFMILSYKVFRQCPRFLCRIQNVTKRFLDKKTTSKSNNCRSKICGKSLNIHFMFYEIYSFFIIELAPEWKALVADGQSELQKQLRC